MLLRPKGRCYFFFLAGAFFAGALAAGFFAAGFLAGAFMVVSPSIASPYSGDCDPTRPGAASLW